eukprot:1877674-Pleurochrysis_carterae.AAC.1
MAASCAAQQPAAPHSVASQATPAESQPRTLRDLPAGAVARMTAAVKAEGGAAARCAAGAAAQCAAGAAVLRPLTTMAALVEEAAAPPQQDVVAETRRLVSHPDFGGAAWAAIFSNG